MLKKFQVSDFCDAPLYVIPGVNYPGYPLLSPPSMRTCSYEMLDSYSTVGL